MSEQPQEHHQQVERVANASAAITILVSGPVIVYGLFIGDGQMFGSGLLLFLGVGWLTLGLGDEVFVDD